MASPGSDEAAIGALTVALSLGSPTSSVPCRLELTGEEHVALFRLVRHAVGLWSRDDCPPTGTSASSPGSGITQRRYGGDRNRATVGEDEMGAGPLLDFQRLYLASGGINLDRSRAAPPRTRKPGRGFIPQEVNQQLCCPTLVVDCPSNLVALHSAQLVSGAGSLSALPSSDRSA